MLSDHFPMLGLRLRTPRLELRLPDQQQLSDLADLAAEGVHDPATTPFTVPWTDLPPAERARSVVQHHWRTLSAATPAAWSLPLTVLLDGVVVGLQGLDGTDFAITREVHTGSWLGMRYHRMGIGTEMRAAVLHLGFAGLGAVAARSGAFAHNAASLGVSRRLGYEFDGLDRKVQRGALAMHQRLRLSRERWERHRTVEVTIEGLEPCLPLLGLPAAAAV
jgi:RimJ/RimL family protein N-acetyltransferase